LTFVMVLSGDNVRGVVNRRGLRQCVFVIFLFQGFAIAGSKEGIGVRVSAVKCLECVMIYKI
ncbi:hypothetical protein ACQP3D_28800, partial [Escherichia coli]